MIYYERADITGTHLTHIVHGCNNQGAFGSGVALAIAKKYPEAQKQYFDLVKPLNNTSRESLLGTAQVVRSKDKIIGNLFTQGSYGRTGVHAQVKYIYLGLKNFIEQVGPQTIASPAIGTGLGGLNWEQVEQAYEQICREYPAVHFTIYRIG